MGLRLTGRPRRVLAVLYRSAITVMDRTAFAAVDWVSRRIIDQRDYPPIHLRRFVGPLRSFSASGAEFAAYFKTICGLTSHTRILDIGCGCGLIVPHLATALDGESSYVGVDIHRPSIEWCQHTLSRAYPHFTFEHIDVENAYYNPSGRTAPSVYVFPFADRRFDLVLLKSVFTHMHPADVENYLREIRRMLSPHGKCLASFYLLNDEQRLLTANKKSKQDFAFGDDDWRYRSEVNPEEAVAFSESAMRAMATRQGLNVAAIHYGTWSGRADGLSFQDLVLLTPA